MAGDEEVEAVRDVGDVAAAEAAVDDGEVWEVGFEVGPAADAGAAGEDDGSGGRRDGGEFGDFLGEAALDLLGGRGFC